MEDEIGWTVVDGKVLVTFNGLLPEPIPDKERQKLQLKIDKFNRDEWFKDQKEIDDTFR